MQTAVDKGRDSWMQYRCPHCSRASDFLFCYSGMPVFDILVVMRSSSVIMLYNGCAICPFTALKRCIAFHRPLLDDDHYDFSCWLDLYRVLCKSSV